MTRVAIVGGGPKALGALVELARAFEGQPHKCEIQVDVFDPHPAGAGAVWPVTTPDYLLLNVPADIVNMSSPQFGYSYRDWALDHPDPRARELYPPRAFMGEYLGQAFSQGLLGSTALRVRYLAEKVTQVKPAGDKRWNLQTSKGDQGSYRLVLLATGHLQPFDPQWYRALEQGVDLPSETIAIQGAALTGIDAVLALTVGRGGTFTADAAGLERYVPSGAEPGSIELISRTGVPLAPKPEPLSADRITAIRTAMQPLVTTSDESTWLPNNQWWETVVQAMVLAAPMFGTALTPQDCRDALFTPDVLGPEESAQQRLAAQLAMNRGARLSDAKWIAGRVWNAGYQSIVESLDRAPRDPAQWAQFRSVAARAEKWAFGPPEITVRRLLALADAGILRWRTAESSPEGIDIVAVTRPPGVKDEVSGAVRDELWQKLLVEGLCVVRPCERGVLTTPHGQCINGDGQPTPGLYAIGRPTEDPVVGHDSLNYRLHGDAQRWAQHVIESLTEES